MYNQRIILGEARKLPVLDRMTPSEFFFSSTTGANPRDSPIDFPCENDKATLQV